MRVVAMQKPGTDPLLKPRHGPGHHRRRQAQTAGRGGEALGFGHGGEDLHRLKTVHPIIP